MKHWILLLTTAAVIGVVALAGFLGYRSSQAQAEETPPAPDTVKVTTCDVERTVTAPGSLVDARQTTVEMPVGGRLGAVTVKAGDRVAAGQVLATLDGREEFEAGVRAAELELLQAQDALQQLQDEAATGSAEAQLALAEAEAAYKEALKNREKMDYPRYRDELVVENAETDYLLAKQEYKEARKAYEKVDHKKLTDPERAQALKALLDAKQKMDRAFAIWNWYLLPYSEEDVQQAEAELALAESRLADARLRWEQLKDGPDDLDLRLAEARISNAQAQLAAAQEALENIELRAPFDGTVVEVRASAGQTLAAGAPVLVLNDPLAVEVEATVIEEDLPAVKAGQPVDLFFDALPDEEIRGVVSRIVPQRVPGDRPLYTVYISLEEVPAELVPGMNADSSITIAQVEGALCLPRAVVGASASNEAMVTVWDGSQEESRRVQVGLRGDVYVEILFGLAAGEQVVVE